MYLLKLALRPWKISPFSQIISALAVGFLLFLVGFLLWMEQGLVPLVGRMQGEQVITAYLDSSVAVKEEEKIVDSVRMSVGAHAEVKLVGVRKFLDDIKAPYPELSRELEDLGSEIETIVPRYISISGLLKAEALDRVKSIQGIESAESSKDRYKHIVGAFRTLRRVAELLAVGLCLALLAGLVQLTRINSHLHADAISLLRLWGAGLLALRAPGVFAGVLVGLAGGVVAAGGWLSVGVWLAKRVKALSPLLREMPLPTLQLGLFLLVAGTLIGLLAGVFGGVPSVSGYKDRG